MRHYVTYFDRNYLAKGVAMLRSLARHEREPHVVYVVCMDELTRTIVDALKLHNVCAVPLHAIERGDAELVGPRMERELVEYYWTLTPTIILRILENDPRIEVLTYLDADLFFFGSPDPIYDELGDQSVLIHEHRFSPDLTHLAENGRFNVGLLCFRNDPRGIQALTWWRDRCNEWCFKRLEDGKMGDQLYLEDWPTRFEGVVVLEHIGAGVAPWNHIQYAVSEGPAVDGQGVVFYHFHAFTVVSPEVFVPASHAVYRVDANILEHLVVPYAEAVAAAYADVQGHLATFRFGIEGAQGIAADCVLIALADVASLLQHAGLPHAKSSLTEKWDVYETPQLVSAAPQPSAVVESSAIASVVVALGESDCTCKLRKLSSAGTEIVIACPPALEDDVASFIEGRRLARMVVTSLSIGAAVNLALALCRQDVIVVADLAGPHGPDWLPELFDHFDASRALRSASAMVLTRSQMEKSGGLAEDFDHLGAALDDFALRLHAHRQPVAIEASARVYPPVAWKELVTRWGLPEGSGQTGALVTAVSPPPETLQRISLPDVARTHGVDDARAWRTNAAGTNTARTSAA